jgi:hypothetical protein
MPTMVTDIIAIAAAVAIVTAVAWAIGPHGVATDEVLRGLFTSGPVSDWPPGVQEDDDPWPEIHAAAARARAEQDATGPVTTARVRRAR